VFVIAGVILLLSCLAMVELWLPEPQVHDEFSYLLQADTFVHWRLANPPHPLWKHFENFHIIQQPTYASKYPPGQGFFLAVGKILGHPILGVWISTALAGAALFWMLCALFPGPWALVGTALAVFNPQVLLWNWSYYGGSVALLGGALVLGGATRNLKKPAPRPSVLMGLGMGILCLTRPFEGFALTVLVTILCSVTYWKRAWDWKPYWLDFIFPVACVVVPVLLFQAFYNFRVTGNPAKMPYTVYEETYSQAPLFLWQSPRPQKPQYSNEQMARLYAEWVDPIYYWQRTLRGFLRYLADKLGLYGWLVWDGLIVVWVVPSILAVKRRPNSRLVVSLLILAFVITFVGPVWAWPHYSAPFYPLLIALLVFAMREAWTWRWSNRRWGRWATRFIFLFLCVHAVAEFVAIQKSFQRSWQYQRAGLEASLRADGKKHLVIVRFGPRHDIHEGWVWNSADIDRASVVWAWDLGEGENQRLRDYFKGYETILMEPDSGKNTKLGPAEH
jgi:hypothetical protein